MNQDEEKEDIPNIGSVLDYVQKLPSLPGIVVDILESFNNEEVNVHTLAHKVARDQALAARVLRVANSPFFGLSGQIGSISEAVSVLGFNNLRGLVMAAAIIDSFPRTKQGFDWMAFWRHGIGAGVCARVLAKRAGLNPETAFTAGLLHDIGRLVMEVYFPQACAQVPWSGEGSTAEVLAAERAALGLDHAGLGGVVAKRWHFPRAIREAIELHHVAAGAGQDKTLTDVVYVANLFAHALADGRIREDKAGYFLAEARKRLGLDGATLEALAGEAGTAYDGAVTLIGG